MWHFLHFCYISHTFPEDFYLYDKKTFYIRLVISLIRKIKNKYVLNPSLFSWTSPWYTHCGRESLCWTVELSDTTNTRLPAMFYHVFSTKQHQQLILRHKPETHNWHQKHLSEVFVKFRNDLRIALFFFKWNTKLIFLVCTLLHITPMQTTISHSPLCIQTYFNILRFHRAGISLILVTDDVWFSELCHQAEKANIPTSQPCWVIQIEDVLKNTSCWINHA